MLSFSTVGFFVEFFYKVEPVKDLLPPSIFSLPQVVNIRFLQMLGAENSGKSSLLEHILKTEIFPRHGPRHDGVNITTKTPMRYELTGLAPGSVASTEIVWEGITKKLSSDAEILVEVKRIMDSIGDDVVPKELIVRRSAPNLPSITFVDLPGLRSTAGLKEKTEALAAKYLGGDHLFVVVVPAASHLFSDLAFGLVTTKGKASSSILVLSKGDLAAQDDDGWHTAVVPRLLGRDAELARHPFKAVVTTKCRKQDRSSRDYIPLSEADEDELSWATDRVEATEDLNAVEREQLRRSMTVLALLSRMDESFHSHATGLWKSSALAKLTPAQAAAEKAVSDLGKAPTSITDAVILDEVDARLKARGLGPLPTLPTFRGITQPRNSRDAADAAVKLYADVETWINEKLDPTRPTNLLGYTELSAAFDAVFGDDKMDLRLKRFGYAKTHVYKAALVKFVTCATSVCPDIKRRALDQLDAAVCTGGPAPVAAVLADVATKMFYRCIGPALGVPSALKADTAWMQAHAAGLRTEDAAVAADRVAKATKLQAILDSMKIVGNIEKRTEEPLVRPPGPALGRPLAGGAAAGAAAT